MRRDNYSRLVLHLSALILHLMTIPNWFWSAVAFLFGINIGSFLNVVIWRLPRGGSLIDPQHSYCPNCEKRLEAIDLVPLFSFLLLGRRCRSCKKPISWRYFTVELLTGVLFVALYLHFAHNVPNAIAFILFTAVLIPIAVIDLESYTIPNSLNILAFIIAIGRDVWGIVQHEPGHELLWNWMPRSVLGAIIGILIFGTVRILGWIWKRVEAMGIGDVYLARAMGAMLISVIPVGQHPLRLFPIWVLLSCFSGLIVGLPHTWMRRKQEEREDEERSLKEREGKLASRTENKTIEQEEAPEEESSLKEQAAEVIEVFWLKDFVDYARGIVSAWRAKKSKDAAPQEEPEEDDWEPGPGAIPFGPFLSVGFLATIFVGEALTYWYLTYALPKPVP